MRADGLVSAIRLWLVHQIRIRSEQAEILPAPAQLQRVGKTVQINLWHFSGRLVIWRPCHIAILAD
jgi:hypothetical protein